MSKVSLKSSKFILGEKVGMTQWIFEDGSVVPVTVVLSEPCIIVSHKKLEVSGYNALVLGAFDVGEKRLNKPKKGVFIKSGLDTFKKVLREWRVDSLDGYDIGASIDISIFSVGERVSVRGVSKGKGFAGTVKRHGFARGPMSHGSKNHRLPGSIGGGTDPGRVFLGTRMGGHMGAKNVIVSNLEIVASDLEKKLLFIKGAIPGFSGGVVEIFN